MTRVVTVPATFGGVVVWDFAVAYGIYDTDTTRVSIVGGGAGDTFADGSDATYAVLPPDVSPTLKTGVGPLLTFPAIDIPEGAYYPGDPTLPGVGYVFTVRGRQEAGSWSGGSQISDVVLSLNDTYTDAGYGRNSNGNYPDTLTTTWRDWVTYNDGDLYWSHDAPVTTGISSDGAYPRTDAFRTGGSEWVLMNWDFYLDAPIHVSEVSLTVMWDGGTGSLPALRQVQRDDGRGLGGVPRAVQRFTRQSSIRTLTAPY